VIERWLREMADRVMLNVVEFRKRAPRARGSGPQCPPADAAPDSSKLASCLEGLRSKAKGDLHNAILMLDLAAQHARQIGKKIGDPALRKTFEEQISTIEQLLQLARDMARKL
jgi:hypothetical protein